MKTKTQTAITAMATVITALGLVLAVLVVPIHANAQVIIGGQHQGKQGTPGGNHSCVNNCIANSSGGNGGSVSGHTNTIP